jgi:CBS domain-containing protein
MLMPTVADLLAVKGSQIHTISPQASVLDAIRRMNQHQIGALVVMTSGRVVGMFTERDVLRRVMAEMQPPESVKVEHVMTDDVICCAPDMDIEDVSRIMSDRKIRHGLISIGDVNAFYASAQEQTINYLTDYIYGRA